VLLFEDWDVEEINISRPSSSASQAILQHSEQHPDNWDDDFEDARNSPRKAITISRPFPQSVRFFCSTTDQTHQTHDYSSTTHLRPSSTFALLPPSPPLHNERERRRLRKKSPPKHQGLSSSLPSMAALPTQARRALRHLTQLACLSGTGIGTRFPTTETRSIARANQHYLIQGV